MNGSEPPKVLDVPDVVLGVFLAIVFIVGIVSLI